MLVKKSQLLNKKNWHRKSKKRKRKIVRQPAHIIKKNSTCWTERMKTVNNKKKKVKQFNQDFAKIIEKNTWYWIWDKNSCRTLRSDIIIIIISLLLLLWLSFYINATEGLEWIPKTSKMVRSLCFCLLFFQFLLHFNIQIWPFKNRVVHKEKYRPDNICGQKKS